MDKVTWSNKIKAQLELKSTNQGQAQRFKISIIRPCMAKDKWKTPERKIIKKKIFLLLKTKGGLQNFSGLKWNLNNYLENLSMDIHSTSILATDWLIHMYINYDVNLFIYYFVYIISHLNSMTSDHLIVDIVTVSTATIHGKLYWGKICINW